MKGRTLELIAEHVGSNIRLTLYELGAWKHRVRVENIREYDPTAQSDVCGEAVAYHELVTDVDPRDQILVRDNMGDLVEPDCLSPLEAALAGLEN